MNSSHDYQVAKYSVRKDNVVYVDQEYAVKIDWMGKLVDSVGSI